MYKSQPSYQWEEISHTQLTLISLSFGGIESENPPPDLDLSVGADNDKAGDEAHNPI